MLPLRRLLARTLVVGVLLLTPIAAAGCGSSGIGGVIAHHVLNRIAPGHAKTFDKLFCAYHVEKLFHDATHHHAIYGAFNLYEAIKNCKAGFSQ